MNLKHNTEKNITIFLIGGNSVIGKSILKGLLNRFKNYSVEIISFVRSEQNNKIIGEKRIVNNYVETIELIRNYKPNDPSKKLVIISFGVLVEEGKNLVFKDNLKYHLEVNTFQNIKILKNLILFNNLTEIHIVSSILADFIRPSIMSYSISKNLLELMIENLNLSKELKNRIFIWKPAFVNSKLNKGRKPTLLKTEPEKISKVVSKTTTGGKHYLPKVSVFFTFIAKFTSPLIKWIDRKY